MIDFSIMAAKKIRLKVISAIKSDGFTDAAPHPEADLELEARNAEADYPGMDEYRYRPDTIGHNPFAFLAYLTANTGRNHRAAYALWGRTRR